MAAVDGVTQMSDEEELVDKLAEWISDPDGAGSDLESVPYREDIWLEVHGNLDLQNLAGDILASDWLRRVRAEAWEEGKEAGIWRQRSRNSFESDPINPYLVSPLEGTKQ